MSSSCSLLLLLVDCLTCQNLNKLVRKKEAGAQATRMWAWQHLVKTKQHSITRCFLVAQNLRLTAASLSYILGRSQVWLARVHSYQKYSGSNKKYYWAQKKKKQQ